jgi:hypothetical protein
MSLKPGGKQWTVCEQIIEDPVTGLTFQFEVVPGTSAPYRLKVYGKVCCGNREILFDEQGRKAGAGTITAGTCKPSWLEQVER